VATGSSPWQSAAAADAPGGGDPGLAPGGHGSFASSHPGRSPGELVELGGLPQVLWPDHCVQGSRGAELATQLDPARIEALLRKGTDPGIDSYSGFFDNGQRRSTGLCDYLRGRGVDEVLLLGLATDYCVKATALDARRLGFRACLIEDGCAGVELRPGDVAAAIGELREAGSPLCAAPTAGASGLRWRPRLSW